MGFPLSRKKGCSALRTGIFKASWSNDAMWFLEENFCALFIVSMRPSGYHSAWLRPGRASFRFVWQDHWCSPASCGSNYRLADEH